MEIDNAAQVLYYFNTTVYRKLLKYKNQKTYPSECKRLKVHYSGWILHTTLMHTSKGQRRLEMELAECPCCL